MKKIIKNVTLYGELTDITVVDGRIAAIGKTEEEGVDFSGCKIYPGLIDTHSHGCIGKDTMDADLGEMARYYLKKGTTTWYPTTMTMGRDDMIRACHAKTEFEGGANIPGFHLEGPFINSSYKGAQNEKYVILPDLDLLNEAGRVKKITLAPEVEGAIEFIKKCPAIVSIGHSDADYDTAKAAFRAGAKCLTHTFNRMLPMLHREPGPSPAGMEEGAYAELISDGVHVHPAMVRLLIKLYGTDRVVLISDSVPPAGLSDGNYELGGLAITVTDGKAYTQGGNLAGSTTCLFECVKRAISFGVPEYDAVKMATETPAAHMGLDTKGKIEVGYDADFIIVDGDFNLVCAIARGEF